MTVTVGIDFGGTATRFVLHDGQKVVARHTDLTADLAKGHPSDRLARVVDHVQRVVSGKSLAAVGIGATGPVDVAAGIIHNPDTLPAFSNLPLVSHLQSALRVPVVIDNDAVAAAIGEHLAGAGQGARRLLMVTLGTGIGVALLVDGKPFRGPDGQHPEAGHIPVLPGGARCYCGVEGCWELLASRQALQALLQPLFDPSLAAADIIATAARDESDRVKNAFLRYGRLVGRGLAALHTVFLPDVTVIGGGAAPFLEHFRSGIAVEIQRSAGFAVENRLRAALLGDDSGAIGAALMARP